jgi:hypothetical protein
MWVRAHVDALPCVEPDWSHVVEEHEWPDVARQNVRQSAPDLEAVAEVVLAGVDDPDGIFVHGDDVTANGVPLAQRCVPRASVVIAAGDTI